ncbi:MAG: hypothetical protein HeimC2_40170 [Candidatus Heimdallarchaeota archaeon LC_2]|nr:MAG: hypothetical protein HeimC2_40170 [Candidatus Heimdallarchaeota archaeon LC_2]
MRLKPNPIKIKVLRDAILEYVTLHPQSTNEAIRTHIGKKYNREMGISIISNATRELKEMGLLDRDIYFMIYRYSIPHDIHSSRPKVVAL